MTTTDWHLDLSRRAGACEMHAPFLIPSHIVEFVDQLWYDTPKSDIYGKTEAIRRHKAIGTH